MSQPDVLRGTYVSLLLGNGAGTEVFAPLCGITARTFTAQINTTDQFTRDCTLPEDVPIRRLIATGKQWDLSGSGLLNRSKLEDIQAALGVTKNWQFELGEPATDEVYGGVYQGPAMLTQLQITGNDDEFAQVELTIASDGAWTFVEAS